LQQAAPLPEPIDPRQNSARKPGDWYRLAASEAKTPASGSEGAALVEDGHSTPAALETTTEAKPAKAAFQKSRKSSSYKRSKYASRASRSARPSFRASNSFARWNPWNSRWARRADRRRDFRVYMVGPPR
jgi:hypothetical protein